MTTADELKAHGFHMEDEINLDNDDKDENDDENRDEENEMQ